MARVAIGLIIGLLLGGALVFYFFVGVPRASVAPGAPVLPPDPSGVPPGTAQIVLRQDFFNTVLQTIFRDMKPPSFPLSASAQQAAPDPAACGSEITVLPEGSGASTSLRLENNSLSAPLAFSGSYASPFGCLRFTGWAQANLGLRYDAAQQSVFGQINVETVNLDGVNPIVGGFITPIVQSTLNNRVNPITIMDGKQVAVSLPIAVQAAVKDVRAEVKDNALNLYVIYDFSGAPIQ
jgi:hypothetical protein